MRLALILLAQLLHREILIPAEAKSRDPNAQPIKSEWPLRECQNIKAQSGTMNHTGCVCSEEYQICQPFRLSATVNGSITLPCSFAYHQDWEPASTTEIRWRLGDFHSHKYMFSCCRSQTMSTHSDFEGRVSLAREGQRYTASIRITNLRESDSRLYFCRVSVKIKGGELKEWQTINGTNLTVTTAPPKAEDGNHSPLPLGILVGVSIGGILLAAAIISGLVKCLLTQRKGHCPQGIQPREVASRGQEEKEAKDQELHYRGAPSAPPWEEPISPPPPIFSQAQGEPVPVYASLVLSEALNKKMPLKRGSPAEETTYAAVRH